MDLETLAHAILMLICTAVFFYHKTLRCLSFPNVLLVWMRGSLNYDDVVKGLYHKLCTASMIRIKMSITLARIVCTVFQMAPLATIARYYVVSFYP